MGVLNEFFLAVDDDEARKAVLDGPIAAGWADVIQASSLTNVEIELLDEAISGRPWAPPGAEVLTAGDDGPDAAYVVRFPDAVVDALLELPTSELRLAADRWAGLEELEGVDPIMLSALLEDLVALASSGATTGKTPYLWVCP